MKLIINGKVVKDKKTKVLVGIGLIPVFAVVFGLFFPIIFGIIFPLVFLIIMPIGIIVSLLKSDSPK